jgi:uncharacterized protein (TIGR02594 family)
MDFLKIFIEVILEFFKNKQIVEKKTDAGVVAIKVPAAQAPAKKEKPAKMFRNKAVLLRAIGELGVKEAAGSKDNPRIVEYQKYSTVKNLFGWADSVPWCATFVCWCLEMVGMTSTNSASARSFEKWGVSVKDTPLPGDIVVFWRDSLASGKGHVTFFLAKKGNLLYCIGGNQSDSVNVSTYGTEKLRDIRRSSIAGNYTAEQTQELKSIANSVLAGKKIDTSGKVV